MSNSVGLIESKGLVALIEAVDVILKNSPVTILGIHKLENGLVTLAVSGNSDYVKAAIESGTEAGRKVGEIFASSVVDNPGKELLAMFGELFPHDEILSSVQDEIKSLRINSGEQSNQLESVVKQVKPESKREKSKPLQVTKVIPIHKIKKYKNQTDNQNKSNAGESSEKEIEEIKIETGIKASLPDSEKPLSTIERLRIEALGLEGKKKRSIEITATTDKKNDEVKSITPSSKSGAVDFDAIDKMNVHKLRHYAREFPDYPIKGREISRANRDELVKLFKSIKNI